MMPGPHNIPPAVPIYPNGRRQHEYYPQYPPQPPPYGGYPPPQQFHPQQPAPPYGPQWYPGYPPQPYSPAPRQFHHPPHGPPQQHGPVIVSSQGHMPPQAMAPPMPRAPNPIPTPTTPAVPHTYTPPQPAPSTPSATSHVQESPATPTTSVSASTPPPPIMTRPQIPEPATPVTEKMPFYPQLPWLSVPDEPFPPRHRQRRRKVRSVADPGAALELPARPRTEEQIQEPTAGEKEPDQPVDSGEVTEEQTDSQSSTVTARSDLETPATSIAPSEADSTIPTTPPTITRPAPASRPATSSTHMRTPTKPVVPVVPITPRAAVPKTQAAPTPKPEPKESAPESSTVQSPPADTAQSAVAAPAQARNEVGDAAPVTQEAPAPAPPPKPKSWAELLRTKAPPAPSASTDSSTTQTGNAQGSTKSGSLAEALRSFSLKPAFRIPFLEPRGLVNTGNMCYMNSILQVLAFCVPFYDFLDQVGKRVTHSFKSETPLLDAMIIFMREFKVIDAAESVEKLRMRLKDNELEQYGDPFAPEYVYEVIRRLPRFAHMRRGHQQDAEEFLGFLLQGLHDECAHALLNLPWSPSDKSPVSPTSESSVTAETGWLEVGPKQKASVTRSSGEIAIDTPLTKIFGGKLRSELRVPGSKNSVTLEPYQPLQLDISSPDVHNITDALKGLTRSETLHGEFASPRGPSATATKQVFIETLPPVLILHLKRFQYDNTGGAQKIWKKVGYPLDLTIPKEVFPPHKRSKAELSGLPQYRLLSVVYHHGKSAAGGHYTVDIRRQEGHEWIRLDDTVIRRLRVEDVAAGGAEEDPRILAKALEQHKKDSAAGKASIFRQLEDDEEDKKSEGGEWSQVNGTAAKDQKKWSAVANGSATPSTAGKRTPKVEGVKDNKVAYILFYRRID